MFKHTTAYAFMTPEHRGFILAANQANKTKSNTTKAILTGNLQGTLTTVNRLIASLLIS